MDLWCEIKNVEVKKYIYTVSAKIQGSPVFSIKNVSILNGHNFGPEKRTETWK